MPITYRIHPGIGIARLGNSPTPSDLAGAAGRPAARLRRTRQPAAFPDGMDEQRDQTFKDAEGRDQAPGGALSGLAYDDESPQGRPLQLGDPIEGGGNAGTLVDIQWRVYLANKKAAGTSSRSSTASTATARPPAAQRRYHRRRGAPAADHRPRPAHVDCTEQPPRRFGRDGGRCLCADLPAAAEAGADRHARRDAHRRPGRLLVLGGHGRSGSFASTVRPAAHRDYANNDGWFDDTSDGPVMARLVMYSELVGRIRYIDVEYPAWVFVGYPRYAPEILDMVTIDDVVQDLAVREFAYRTDLYGTAGTFDHPQKIPPTDQEALVHWRAGRLEWNPELPALVLPRHLDDPLPPRRDGLPVQRAGAVELPAQPVDARQLRSLQAGCRRWSMAAVARGVTAACGGTTRATCCSRRSLRPRGAGEAGAQRRSPRPPWPRRRAASESLVRRLGNTIRTSPTPSRRGPGDDYAAYLERWRDGADTPAAATGQGEARGRGGQGPRRRCRRPRRGEAPAACARSPSSTCGGRHRQLPSECRARLVEASTRGPLWADAEYLFDLLRQPGEENEFRVGGKPNSRRLQPAADAAAGRRQPDRTQLPSKFLRLTDYQLYLLRQWARGMFYNESSRAGASPIRFSPTGLGEPDRRAISIAACCQPPRRRFLPRRRGRLGDSQPVDLSRAVSPQGRPRLLQLRADGGAGERQPRGRARARLRLLRRRRLSQDNNFDIGLQPGDLTKYLALPWQADFNECTTQMIDITYEAWNEIDPTASTTG